MLVWGSLLISSIYDKEFPLFQRIMISLLLVYALWRISYDDFIWYFDTGTLKHNDIAQATMRNAQWMKLVLMQSNLSGSSLKTICLITFSSPLRLVCICNEGDATMENLSNNEMIWMRGDPSELWALRVQWVPEEIVKGIYRNCCLHTIFPRGGRGK